MTLLALPLSTPTQAGVFGIPHFVAPGKSALGVEPELTLSDGAGIGANLKYTYGMSDLNNVTAIIGTGSGPRRFRVGGSMTFDFFPDVEGQPGIGLATQGVYYNLKEHGQFELTAVPYIHKSFMNDGKDPVEPFLAFPFGLAFASGVYKATTNIAVGAIFKASEKINYVTEVGVAINNAESYVSGGFLYYF